MKITFRTLGLLAALGLLTVGLRFAGADDKKSDDTKAPSDQDCISQAVNANLMEINLANLAKKVSANDDVKKFADDLIKGHEALNKTALKLANDKRVAVVSGLAPKEREETTRLSGLTPKDFDREWVNLMVKNHEQAISQFEHCSHSKDDAVKKMAEDALPKLRDHLKEAKALQDKLSGKSNKKDENKK